MWDAFIELVRALILTVAHALPGGSVGGSIAIVSLAVRIALIPLTLRLAKRARERQALIEKLQPQLARIQARHKAGKLDKQRVALETYELYKRNGVRMFDPLALAAIAIQWPLLGGLFAAVRTGLGAGKRFLWIADLSRPDALVAFLASGLVALSVMAMGPTPGAPGVSAEQAAQMQRFSVILAAVGTLVMLMASASAVGISVASGAVRGVVGAGANARHTMIKEADPH